MLEITFAVTMSVTLTVTVTVSISQRRGKKKDQGDKEKGNQGDKEDKGDKEGPLRYQEDGRSSSRPGPLRYQEDGRSSSMPCPLQYEEYIPVIFFPYLFGFLYFFPPSLYHFGSA